MDEALIILAEDCAEVIKSVSKIQRMGLSDPQSLKGLEDSIGDVLALIAILGHNGVLEDDNVMGRIPAKLKELKRESSINDLDSIIKNI